MDNQVNDYKFFEENRAKLVTAYPNKFVVIADEEVVGVFDSEEEAYDDSVGKYKLGTFLIQQCIPAKEEEVAVFHTKAIFS